MDRMTRAGGPFRFGLIAAIAVAAAFIATTDLSASGASAAERPQAAQATLCDVLDFTKIVRDGTAKRIHVPPAPGVERKGPTGPASWRTGDVVRWQTMALSMFAAYRSLSGEQFQKVSCRKDEDITIVHRGFLSFAEKTRWKLAIAFSGDRPVRACIGKIDRALDTVTLNGEPWPSVTADPPGSSPDQQCRVFATPCFDERGKLAGFEQLFGVGDPGTLQDCYRPELKLPSRPLRATPPPRPSPGNS